MNNISNIHKSPAFTILVIIFTFIGIISSFQYSKYKNSLFNESFKYSSAISKKNYSDFKSIINNGGFVICGWDGTDATEEAIKKETKATIRCIPFNQDIDNLKCIYSGNVAQYKVIFSKAY